MSGITPAAFISKWPHVQLTERSASQQHFLDLCEVLEHPKPAEADPAGEWFTFERGADKRGGGRGWADVWKRGFFGWEYKGKRKNLDAAFDQLLLYRESLENPPLLVVCDMDRVRVHTNFTAAVNQVHEIRLEELGEPRNLEVLRAVFFDPGRLRPQATVNDGGQPRPRRPTAARPDRGNSDLSCPVAAVDARNWCRSETPTVSLKTDLSRCHPMPAPGPYSVTSTC